MGTSGCGTLIIDPVTLSAGFAKRSSTEENSSYMFLLLLFREAWVALEMVKELVFSGNV